MKLHVDKIVLLIISCTVNPISGFWDLGTTTPGIHRTDTKLRSSFFRWQETDWLGFIYFWYPVMDWVDIHNRRRLCMVAGISIGLGVVWTLSLCVFQAVAVAVTSAAAGALRVKVTIIQFAANTICAEYCQLIEGLVKNNGFPQNFLPLSTAALLNTRILITSANYLDPYMDRQKDIRIWAMGRAGKENTPYRYRVWRVWRVLPKSLNPEHQHGTRGTHVPRHDVAVIVSFDRMYIFAYYSLRYLYAYKATLVGPHETLSDDLLITGSGYEYLTHIYENYKLFYSTTNTSYIVDCSKYLPKWWGKFICIKNVKGFPGIQNGGPLFSGFVVVGVGCFEIRYNEDRIFVFTDLRYYVYLIYKYADIKPGDYYEYAYPQWSIQRGSWFDGWYNYRYIPTKQLSYDLFPLGK